MLQRKASGSSTAAKSEQEGYDQARTRYLQGQGYRVLRFWNNDVLTNIESVLEVLVKAFASLRPSPPPSPPCLVKDGGEGAWLAGEIDE
ncbi:MAG TPA: DUF559 domain-containing protein [Frateuria sp.]|uniref:DUF559 domain-containing protein n=1 Tax=Frateuria sp. TaxID=2211372 RepID=UPI002DE4734B|nr:DUF559 domain-containing protein [Frateuria sp.]